MGWRINRQRDRLVKLNEQAADGEITQEELEGKEAKVLEKIVKICPHANTEDQVLDGQKITWCADCGTEI